MRAVFLDTDWLGPEVPLDPLRALPLDWTFYASTSHDELTARLQGAEIAVGKCSGLSRETFRALPALRLVCVAGTGYNHVDLEAAAEAGVLVCNAPGYSTTTVAQLTMLFLLSLSTQGFANIASEPFQIHSAYPLREVRDKKLGIIGFGQIGRAVARLAEAFGMEILVAEYASNLENGYPLAALLPQIDYLTVHVPLTPRTENLIARREIELMKPTACLINTARGKIFNERDLADALKAKRLAGAAIDVFSVEPPPPDHPLLDPSIPNLILTPHIGWASKEARVRLIQVIQENIRAYLAGAPQNCVSAKPAFV